MTPPYDPYATPNPWWRQQQAPQRPVQFDPAPTPSRPKQWWEGALGPKSRLANNSPDPSNSTSQPASLLDMMMKTGGNTGRPSLGPIPGMGLANMPMSMWEQLTGMFGGTGSRS